MATLLPRHQTEPLLCNQFRAGDPVASKILVEDVARLPIFRIDFTAPMTTRAVQFEKTKQLYDKSLVDGDAVPSLNFVDSELQASAPGRCS